MFCRNSSHRTGRSELGPCRSMIWASSVIRALTASMAGPADEASTDAISVESCSRSWASWSWSVALISPLMWFGSSARRRAYVSRAKAWLFGAKAVLMRGFYDNSPEDTRYIFVSLGRADQSRSSRWTTQTLLRWPDGPKAGCRRRLENRLRYWTTRRPSAVGRWMTGTRLCRCDGVPHSPQPSKHAPVPSPG